MSFIKLLFCTISFAVVLPVFAESIDPNLNYTYLYFENGYPTRLVGRRPQSEANTFARATPDLVVQTGYYSLKLDCDDIQLRGYDALIGSDYMAALTQDVEIFTKADLSLIVTKDGREYTCTSARVQDKSHQYVRLIESGQFVQRFDHQGLEFSKNDRGGARFRGRLEVTAWPDRVVFKLDLTDVADVTQTKIRLVTPTGKVFESETDSAITRLVLRPHLDIIEGVWENSAFVREAKDEQTGKKLDYYYDEDVAAIHVDVPAERVSYPADTDRFDEYIIEVTNPTDSSCHLPLLFDQIVPRAITGTVMVLCEEDGRPTGIPVQISKNWHKDKNQPTLHEGSWLRGYTMIPLAEGEVRRFRLRVIYGYWAGVGAVSHAQLCLIGYGGNWKWDESALGAWGESMTYDPTLHLGAAFIDDVRPTYTTGMSGRQHNWTENVGGGDFLVYYDQANRFRWAKRIKTAYRWTGPNMTEVWYSGITDDDKIRFTYRTRSVRTNDYHRRFHAYQYHFQEDVTSPHRLVFQQMAADYYSYVQFERFHLGNKNGLQATHSSPTTKKGYVGKSLPFDQRWLAIDDTQCNSGPAMTRRGLIMLSCTLNGRSLPTYLHLYRLKENNALFDLSSDSVHRSYKAGDVVKGELVFIMPPKTTDDYWGADQDLRTRLTAYGDNAWQAVFDECRYNNELQVTAHQGALLNNYPVEIQASESSDAILADFSIHGGGIGHVPVILKDVCQSVAIKVERYFNGNWIPLESVDVDQHNYYQGYQNAQGRMDYVFNIKRPSPDLQAIWRLRIVTFNEGRSR